MQGNVEIYFSVLMRFRKFQDFRLFYYLCLYDDMHGERRKKKNKRTTRGTEKKIATNNQKIPY